MGSSANYSDLYRRLPASQPRISFPTEPSTNLSLNVAESPSKARCAAHVLSFSASPAANVYECSAHKKNKLKQLTCPAQEWQPAASQKLECRLPAKIRNDQGQILAAPTESNKNKTSLVHYNRSLAIARSLHQSGCQVQHHPALRLDAEVIVTEHGPCSIGA